MVWHYHMIYQIYVRVMVGNVANDSFYNFTEPAKIHFAFADMTE